MTIEISGTLANPDNPRICYNNLAKDASVTVSTETTGFVGTNTQNALTYNFWKPTALPATIEYDIGTQTTVDFCGIAAHNLGTSGCTVTLQYDDGMSPASWVTIDSQAPSDNSIILFLFDSIASNKFRLLVEAVDSNSTVPALGVVYLGQQLAMPLEMYGGHTPITLSKTTVVRPQTSEGGQWLGISKIRQGAATTIDFSNLTASWLRSNFKPFMDDAIDNPFFWAWRPTSFTSEVAYCKTNGDIAPSNTGQADLMQVSFSVNGRLE